MAEHLDKPLHVRAYTYGGWHTQLPDDSMFESTWGQISPSKSHHLSAQNLNSQQQDAVCCSMSNNSSLLMPLHFSHPMRWPQNLGSDESDFPSIDSAHFGFDSDLDPTEQTRYGASNNSYIEVFRHQPARIQVEPSVFDLRSPISGLWPLNLRFYRTERFS